ncbi:MAG: 2-hydroxyacid dehydrogenase [Endozoicomonadaceae bacterium]|nr:2-hydroxyacid dehydrogenase [Endozoicomonadaceae bacterium]
MKIAVFSAQPYDEEYFNRYNKYGYSLTFFKDRLCDKTAKLALQHDAICVFTNDDLGSEVIKTLAGGKIKIIALRCAGFNNIDLQTTKDLNIAVVRVPTYSPEAVAEHTIALLLTLNRKLHQAHNRVKENNFSLDGLMGYNLHKKTIGVIGTGSIGLAFCRIMKGFGCSLLAFDPQPNKDAEALGVRYVPLDELVVSSDIISLHCPLLPNTHHLVNEAFLEKAKQDVVLINTSRGKLVDTQAAITYLKKGKIKALAIDVYEKEEAIFFKDLSGTGIQDDQFKQLSALPNVLISAHQAFFTHEAMYEIVNTTYQNLKCFEENLILENTV